MTAEDKRPFAPHYAVTSEYLFDLAQWFARQGRLPEVEDIRSDFQYMHQVDEFRERVFAIMVGSQVTIKPSYWLTDLTGGNVIHLEGNWSSACQQAIDHSEKSPGSAFKLLKQYIHTLKTVTEKIGIVFAGDIYYRR